MIARDGVLWTACTGSDEIVAIDERTGEAVRRVAVEGRPDTLAPAADGNLWVSLQTGPKLALVEPRVGRVMSRWPVHSARTPLGGTVDVAPVGQRVWLSSYAAGLVHGVDVTRPGG
jgi:sugar lactone lactonase YvrE